MEIILSTRNPSKVEEVRAIFHGSNIEILTLDDAKISGEAVEDGQTLLVNAAIKARFAWEKAGGKNWAMADDTGIFIDALGDKPGVRSARWAGENVSTEETTLYALKQLKGLKNRRAIFKTMACVVSPNGKMAIFPGEIPGTILETPRVKPLPKMPYSCLFVPDGQMKSLAEMSVEERNAVSHRAIAFRSVRKFLEKQI